MIINTTSSSNNPLRFRRNLFDTEISALLLKNQGKYELLTGEGLDLKPSTVSQAKFEYSPLGEIFNKGLSEDDKKKGILKRLKNIEDENKVKNKVEKKT